MYLECLMKEKKAPVEGRGQPECLLWQNNPYCALDLGRLTLQEPRTLTKIYFNHVFFSLSHKYPFPFIAEQRAINDLDRR